MFLKAGKGGIYMGRLKRSRFDKNVGEQPASKKRKAKKGNKKEIKTDIKKEIGNDSGELDSLLADAAETGSTKWQAATDGQSQQRQVPPVPGGTVHKRRVRLAGKVKTATAEEAEAVVRTSIFTTPGKPEFEKDYVQPTKVTAKSFLEGQPDYDELENGKETPLELKKEIADAFGIESSAESCTEDVPSIFMFLGEEQDEEPLAEGMPVEEEPLAREELLAEKEPLAGQAGTGTVDVLGRLAAVSDMYFNGKVFAESDKCILYYADESVDSVVISEDSAVLLPVYRVYVNGKLQKWDRLFEIKIPAGSLVEVETGVKITVPGSVHVRLVAVDDLKCKYSLESVGDSRILSRNELKEPLVMSFRACEGAYLSKAGRVVECQIAV